MKKFIFLICSLFSTTAYAQQNNVKIWLVNADYAFYLGQTTIDHINLPTAKLALVRSATDTLWFVYRTEQLISARLALNPADLLPKSRFTIGDSVSAYSTETPEFPKWVHGKVLQISSTGRVLIRYKDREYDVDRNKILNVVSNRWFDADAVEEFANSKKFK